MSIGAYWDRKINLEALPAEIDHLFTSCPFSYISIFSINEL